VAWLIEQTCEHMYSIQDENKFLEVTYAKGDRETFYYKDFSSGAMIENIVARAKKLALKRYLATHEKGIKLDDLLNAVQEEFKENEDLRTPRILMIGRVFLAQKGRKSSTFGPSWVRRLRSCGLLRILPRVNTSKKTL